MKYNLSITDLVSTASVMLVKLQENNQNTNAYIATVQDYLDLSDEERALMQVYSIETVNPSIYIETALNGFCTEHKINNQWVKSAVETVYANKEFMEALKGINEDLAEKYPIYLPGIRLV